MLLSATVYSLASWHIRSLPQYLETVTIHHLWMLLVWDGHLTEDATHACEKVWPVQEIKVIIWCLQLELVPCGPWQWQTPGTVWRREQHERKVFAASLYKPVICWLPRWEDVTVLQRIFLPNHSASKPFHCGGGVFVHRFAGLKSFFYNCVHTGRRKCQDCVCLVWMCGHERESSAPLTYGLMKVRHGSRVWKID